MKKWIWQLYGCVLTIMAIGSIRDLYASDSQLRTYYTVLIAFDQHYLLLFILNILSILFGLLGPIVVFLYSLDIKSTAVFWRFCFWMRLFIDAIGHTYDRQFISASFNQSYVYGLACIGILILPLIPSYLAHYLYAFKKLN